MPRVTALIERHPGLSISARCRRVQCILTGLVFLPEWLVDKDLKAKRLRRVLADWNSESVTAWAIFRAELRGSPRIHAFVEALNR
ncbi:MAG TPA: LysR substrate-binding domain-containing protein [Polyangiaceae bacterium]